MAKTKWLDYSQMKESYKPKEECPDCGEYFIVDKLYEDVREPPIEEGPCLCKACATVAAEDRIEELQSEIEHIQGFISKLRRKRK